MARRCYGPPIARNGALRVIDCHTCGYAHLQPKPTQAQLDRLYADEYYQKYNAGWFEKERREQWYWRKVYGQRLEYGLSGVDSPRFIVDWGAGCGWFVKAAGHCGFNALGYEPSRDARAWALKNITKIPLYGTHETIGGLHFIHCSMVLEHVLDPLDLLKTLKDKLRDGGRLCVVVPNEFNPLQRQLTKRFGYTPVHEHHVTYFTR
jgi:SAM-dependent methyltransferase